MAAKVQYPLAQVLEVKHKRVEDQEKVVQEKIKQLEDEKEKLKQREEEKEKVVKHYNDKLKQLRDELDHGTTTDKIQQMKAYLKVAKERVKVEEKKVQEQKDQVAQAEKNLENARLELKMRRMDVDKLESHKLDWQREVRKEQEIVEGREQDELGSVIFMTHKKKTLER